MEPQIIAMFTRVIGETLTQACQVHCTCSCHVFFRLVLILSSHLFLTLPTGVLPPRFSHFTLTSILYVNCKSFS